MLPAVKQRSWRPGPSCMSSTARSNPGTMRALLLACISVALMRVVTTPHTTRWFGRTPLAFCRHLQPTYEGVNVIFGDPVHRAAPVQPDGSQLCAVCSVRLADARAPGLEPETFPDGSF